MQILSDSSIYVSASKYDPSGFGTIQAAHAGCRLLLRDTARYRALWGSIARHTLTRMKMARCLSRFEACLERQKRMALRMRRPTSARLSDIAPCTWLPPTLTTIAGWRSWNSTVYISRDP